jgi:YVTN family beta-propeller protein
MTAPPKAGGVYAGTDEGMLAPATEDLRDRIYVPNSESDSVDVIDPDSAEVVRSFPVGGLPQHVTPSFDLETLWVNSNAGNTLQRIDPRTGRPDGKPIPVDAPYNLYFTPDGEAAIVVAERLERLDFRDPDTMELQDSLDVPCEGVNHMDFSPQGDYLVASCEFDDAMIKVDLERREVVDRIKLGDGTGMPQDVRLAPDGRTFYAADMVTNGVYVIDGQTFEATDFISTGAGAHGIYPSRDAQDMYVSNRDEGTVSVLDFDTGEKKDRWSIPGGGSPDMGGVSPDGDTLWLSGRYHSEVYAFDTGTGKLIHRIPVGAGPHGLAVWPQPGSLSLGHTGNMR